MCLSLAVLIDADDACIQGHGDSITGTQMRQHADLMATDDSRRDLTIIEASPIHPFAPV